MKIMSRPLRIQYPNAWYHVMNRGRRAEIIFRGKKDYFAFIDLLKETVDLRLDPFMDLMWEPSADR